MIEGNLIPNLKKFGLSENEAKAYVGLVFLREATARELHAVTEIPRVKVYEVLDNLIEKRYASVLHGTPTHYKATEPEDLLQMLREEYEKTAEEISKSFEEMEFKPFGEEAEEFTSIQYLRSEWTVRKKLNEILNETNRDLIILSRSPEAMREIENELVAAKKRLNILILVKETEGYEKYSLPVTKYPDNIRPLLQELEESHLVNQSCSIISDVKKALAIRKDETKMEAHYISQPMVDFMYKTIFYFVTNANSVQLPEHFNIPKSTEKEQPKEKQPKEKLFGKKCDMSEKTTGHYKDVLKKKFKKE